MMPKVWSLQSNMNRGELDPRLEGRKDLDAYYNGVANASNVLCLPLGGMKKRPGMEYIGDATNTNNVVRLETFSFSTADNYLLVFTDQKMEIYKDGVLQTNINGSGNDYLTTPWDDDLIPNFDYIQTADTIIIVHWAYRPQKIVRSSDTAWALSAISFDNIPQYDFDDAASPSETDCVQTITLANGTAGDRFKLALDGLLTDEIALGAGTQAGSDATARSIQDELLGLKNTPNTGIAVTGNATATVFTVTFSESATRDWEAITGAIVFSQQATFSITGAITTPGVARSEDVWSSTRGWPQTVTFHEGRLYFGGSSSLPSTIWGSMVNDFFNFGTRKAYDDEGVSITLDTDQINVIHAIYSNRRLQIFTTGGEFYVPQSPITPTNISAPRQSQYGSKRIRPVSIDGVTIFAHYWGKSLIQYVYLDEYQASQAASISILSSHLINDPVKMAVNRGTTDDDVNYVYSVNAVGNMTVFNTLNTQEVAGFTRWNSAPSVLSGIKSVAVVAGQIYLAVERTINGADVIQIEMQNDDLNTDGAFYTTGAHSSISSGLDHLEGAEVVVKVDGVAQTPKTVTSGAITLDYASTETVEIGLEYTPLIQTLPLNVNLDNGPDAFIPKKIVRAVLKLYESNGVFVNGYFLADRTIGEDQFSAPIPFTGTKQIYLDGFNVEAQLIITQETPFAFTLLNIGMEVKT